ncbi:metallophosphoesterase [Microvirga soli]|uniref:metallophosphoesterase n=1 Tax=Microvirga soli TaxID=1854496 RepID=UPI00191F6DF5|nr:metallophosphoesterase [Microvirga soli]
MYDIIGDVHGHAEALRALLGKLGYRERGGAWRHPERTAIFVGDLIDRGPQQIETVLLVRAMVDAGSALITLGNHEYNALMWATPDPDRPGAFMRRHDDTHRNQHKAFLGAVGENSDLHRECLRFFESIPLWLDLPYLRVVHACWHPAMLERLRPYLVNGALPREHLIKLARKGTETEEALEVLVKGLEEKLPHPVSFLDKDGKERREVRLRWWLEPGATFQAAAVISEELRELIPETPVRNSLLFGGEGGLPIFFGHYWMKGEPILMSPRAACVDWSIAAGGVLAAYRFDGEPVLTAERFVTAV